MYRQATIVRGTPTKAHVHVRDGYTQVMADPAMSPAPEHPVYSVTSLMVYESCPLQYYYAFVLGIPPPRTPGMIRGTNIHKLISNHYRQRELVPDTLTPELQALFDDFKRSRFNVAPVASEKPFRLSLGAGDVRGRIDLVLPRDDGKLEVVDFKSGHPQERRALHRHLQLPLYTLAVSSLYDKPVDDLAYTYYFLRDQTEVSFTPSPGTMAELKGRVEGLMQRIQAERFEPTPGCQCYACRREQRSARRQS